MKHNTILNFKYLFVVLGFLIVLLSAWFTHHLFERFELEEKRKIEIWAEATRQFILADEMTDIEFVSNIIAGNTTIPVYIVDKNDKLIDSRNVKEPKRNVEDFYQRKIAQLKASVEPIEVRLKSNRMQYIYYDDSILLTQLYYFPYIQVGVIVVFVFVIFLFFFNAKRSEQNRVWVGLSRETAHQLGTPISSLLAWHELLRNTYPNEPFLPEMAKDINRLQIIADRFSKIGSMPKLTPENLLEVILKSIQYMNNRTSDKVHYKTHFPESCSELLVPLNRPLFEWVIENLCKNAIDAMNGVGNIDVTVSVVGKSFQIDVTDTGKGIERSMYKTIFKPGFTTKTRGWGLGLSLVKRIVEEYHGGKIFVRNSILGKGTTFRIVLKNIVRPLQNGLIVD